MNGKANPDHIPGKPFVHHCPRHHDLTILLKAAKKPLCNSCFATLKKSYFNVIAGLLLGEEYLNNLTRGLIEQNNSLQKQIQDQQQHLLNLTHELAEIKNNGRNNEKPRPETPEKQNPNPTPLVKQHAPSKAQEICTEGHVAKVTRSLQDLLHLQVARVLLSWKKADATTTPKSDDLQDSKATTPTPQE